MLLEAHANVSFWTTSTTAGVLIGIPRMSIRIPKSSLENGARLMLVQPLLYTPSDVSMGYRFQKTGKHGEIFLATKFGITSDLNRPANGEPEYAKQCLATSLERLQGRYRNYSGGSGAHCAFSGLCRSMVPTQVCQSQTLTSDVH